MASDADTHDHHGIDYLELAVADMAAAQAFYGAAFGWRFTDYGPDYAGFVAGSAPRESGGLRRVDAAGDRGALAPLPILYSGALEASRERVRAAGGAITRDIFAFPGGRRFEFTDPSGNALAVWSDR